MRGQRNLRKFRPRTVRRCLRLAGVLLAASTLAACNTPLNILARLDGPYISPERRAELAYRAAQDRQALAVPAAISAAAAPIPAPAPTPVSAPAPIAAPALVVPPAAPEPAPPAPLPQRPAAPPPAALAPPVPAPVTVAALPAAVPDRPARAVIVPLPASPMPRQGAPAASVTVAEAFAASPPPASAPAPVVVSPASPISPAAGLMGPVVTRERPAAPLETHLPSAFDLSPPPPEPVRRRPVPAGAPPQVVAAVPPPAREQIPAIAAAPAPVPATPTGPAAPSRDLERAAASAGLRIVSALPMPAAPPASSAMDPAGGVLREFYDFAIARLDALPAPGGRESMLLADPPSLDPALKRCGNLPPAVLIDVDPGNGLLPLVSNDSASPDLARYLGLLRERGVTVFWISGHGPGAASQIRQRLVASGLDPAGADPLIVTRFAGESKQARRYGLGETNCVIAMMGDQRGDFDELYDFVLDPIMAAPLEEHVNHGWFLAPPPLD